MNLISVQIVFHSTGVGKDHGSGISCHMGREEFGGILNVLYIYINFLVRFNRPKPINVDVGVRILIF